MALAPCDTGAAARGVWTRDRGRLGHGTSGDVPARHAVCADAATSGHAATISAASVPNSAD